MAKTNPATKEPKLVLLIAEGTDDFDGEGIDLTGPGHETFSIFQRALDMYIDYPLDKTPEAQARRRQALKIKTDLKNARLLHAQAYDGWHARMLIGGRRNGAR